MGQSASFLTHPLPHLKESSIVSFVRYDNLSEPSHKSSHTSSHKSEHNYFGYRASPILANFGFSSNRFLLSAGGSGAGIGV